MIKANIKTLIITSIITILPIFIGIYFWSKLPDVMATHFDGNNEANGYTAKLFAVFGLPLILLAVQWIAAVVTANDPRKQNISPKIYTLILWIIPVVSIIGAVGIYPYNLGYALDSLFMAKLFLGFVFLIMGNFLPKTRQNYTIGIKLPWTLADEENWNKTHRLAGILWTLGGLLIIVFTFLGFMPMNAYFVILCIMVLVPTVYSYVMHIRKKQ
ncbi:MAG: SdpI family protein [Lachnospiraceae bacterium]|nr:SdpI family protein [Lachnospiraceae bacterium]